MSDVRYLTDVFEGVQFIRKDVPRFGMMQQARGQGADGYGKKISTDYMAILNGRKYRVYAVCFSNAASHYVTIKKESYYLRDFDIPDEVRNGPSQ